MKVLYLVTVLLKEREANVELTKLGVVGYSPVFTRRRAAERYVKKFCLTASILECAKP